MNLLLAAICVLLFSATAPATRLAALVFPAESVAILRLLIAGTVALITIGVFDRKLPPRRVIGPLLITSFGSVIGFSFLIAWAMKLTSGTHGAIGMATIPAFTAAYASIRDRRNPGVRFWIFAGIGTLSALGFFVSRGAQEFNFGDVLIGLSCMVSALGYVEGGRLSREFGGRRVMSWAILFALPWIIAAAFVVFSRSPLPSIDAAPQAWGSVLYLGVVSQTLGMFLWYRVLARGPMEKIALVQLAQPFLALLLASHLLDEHLEPSALIAATLVVGSIFGANRSQKETKPAPEFSAVNSTLSRIRGGARAAFRSPLLDPRREKLSSLFRSRKAPDPAQRSKDPV